MEVHHSHAGNKKFKEYFFEFIMIFLAVTLGFFAESLREHIGDRTKEKEYVKSFVDDLKKDTNSLHFVIRFDSIKDKGLDTILSFQNRIDDTTNQKLLFYYNLKYLDNLTLFKGSDVVIQQLKNTGNLRLIIRDHVADSIISYDQSIRDAYGQGDIYSTLFNEMNKVQLDMFDYTQLANLKNYDKAYFLNLKDPILNKDPLNFKLFFNKVYAYKSINLFYYKQLLVQKEKLANRMILLLQKEYNLEK